MKYGVLTYLSTDGKVLMIKKKIRENDPNSGMHTLPGGKLENFEKGGYSFGRLEAAVRETEDETGLTLLNPRLKGTILFDNSERVFDNWKNPHDFLVYIFQAMYYKGTLKNESEEGIPLWIDKKDIPLVPKNTGDEKVYEWIQDGRFFTGVIKHKGKELDAEGTFVDYFLS